MNEDGALFKILIFVIVASLIMNGAKNVKMKKNYEEIEDKNSINYSDEIEEYNKEIEDYAKYIKNLELTDLETIIKVMDDQWNNYTYKVQDDTKVGYYRIDFKLNKSGVCTAFADDFTAKMNAINSDYNAQNMICCTTNTMEEQKFDVVDIERKYELPEVKQESIINKIKMKKYGNHMVSVVNISGYNIVVDSTNLSLGFIDGDEIYLFNSNSYDSFEYVSKANDLYDYYEVENAKEMYTDNEVSTLCSTYSVECQKEAYTYVKSISTPYKF